MDTEGHVKNIMARLARSHAERKGPMDPTDPASVEEHKEHLNDLDNNIIIAKLSINDDNPSGE